jgi:hypothetical protein
VQQLLAKPGGGEAWLLSLRGKPYAEAHEALCSLPGVGPKVAACICLFSLDKVGAGKIGPRMLDCTQGMVCLLLDAVLYKLRLQLPTRFAAYHDFCWEVCNPSYMWGGA